MRIRIVRSASLVCVGVPRRRPTAAFFVVRLGESFFFGRIGRDSISCQRTPSPHHETRVRTCWEDVWSRPVSPVCSSWVAVRRASGRRRPQPETRALRQAKGGANRTPPAPTPPVPGRRRGPVEVEDAVRRKRRPREVDETAHRDATRILAGLAGTPSSAEKPPPRARIHAATETAVASGRRMWICAG